jgi:eukaryotic-like serine/threonine-protein kinase
LSPEASALGRLAASVADGSAVDWSHVESDVAPRERRLVRHLRLVESIASLYRSIPDLEETLADGLPSGPRWGRLVLLDRIGQGTSCDVHRAFDTDLHRHVALKLLHEDGIAGQGAHDRILQEARRLARVRHPHVVQVFGAEQHMERVGLWMELVEGESLDQLVRTRGMFGAREASGIGQDICSALAAVHGAGLLHRDVKAQNVLREEGGRIVLMDFGTGEELRREGGTARLVGTPLYLAPEIFEGKPASVQSDLYSVGVLLFYLVTGEFPVAAATMEQLKAAQGKRQARRLRDVRPDLPSTFVTVIDRALDPDPAARYQTAGEMEAALRDLPAAFRPATLVEVPKPTASIRRPAVILSMAALLALIVGLIVWQQRAGPGVPTAQGFVRMAVLPFTDLSATPTPFLADGLTDQLVSTLGQLHSLRVTAPGSVARYKSTRLPAADIARQLGVDTVVQGTITADPPVENKPRHARVVVTVIRAGAVAPLWSKSFDWVAGDGRALQSGITREVAKAINASVGAVDIDQASKTPQTNPNAEEAYFRGRSELTGYGPDASRRALEAFRRALTFDPDHAGAHAGASRAYVRLGQFGSITQAEARQQGLAEARAALSLDQDLAEAHLAMADLAFFFDWDWNGAQRAYEKSLDLNPSLSGARMNYAELLAARQRFPEALRQAQMGHELDPNASEVSLAQGVVLLYARKLDEAERVFQAAALAEPDSAPAFLMRGRVAELRGRYAEALELVKHAADLSAGGGVPMQITVLQLEARAGKAEEARAGLAALEEQAANRKIRLTHRDRAYVKLALGDKEAACDEFERALDERDASLIWLGVDPRVDSLRDNARFGKLLKQIGLV